MSSAARARFALSRAVEAGDVQRQHDVFEHVAVEQQLVILEDQAEVAAQEGHGAAPQLADVLAVHHHAAGVGPLDGGDQFQQVLLPAPDWPVRNTISPVRR